MKIIKSPVFYFGIVLALVVSLALLAPYIVDWGRYRADLESWGQKLTGRDVAIRGDISVKLFPFPELSAQDVVIANPDGFREPVFASLEHVDVQVTLGGLLNGELQVESIGIVNPVATLVRDKDNRVNWQFEPAVALRNSRLLEKVRLDQIAISGGTVHLLDEQRDKRGEITALAGTVSAPSLAGPWRASGQLSFNDLPLTYSLSTAAWNEQLPLRFGVRLTPAEQSGYSVSIEGEKTADATLKGEVRLTPVEVAEGKSDSEGQFRAVTVKASYVASFDRLDLAGIEIRPADEKDQGTLITGTASAAIGETIAANIDISAPRVDLDALAGAGSRQLLRDGGGLSLVNGLLASLPKELELKAKLKVLALRAGGEILENAEIAFETGSEAVQIKRFAAGLPGRSKLLFSGVFFPGERFAELGGKLSLESFDMRQLSFWLAPEMKAELARAWTGNRGRLKAESELRLTASKLEFRDLKYELNGDAGTGRFAMLVNGERPILDIELHTDRLDADAFLPDGIGSLSNGGMRWSWFLQNFLAGQSRRDMRLVLDAKQLLLNGVDANNVAADVETTVRGVDVKKLSAASVGGARFEASGVMLSTEVGTDGDIKMKVAADDPRGLLRLAGLLPRSGEVAWSRPLGRTDLDITLSAKPGDKAGSFHLAAAGDSGPFAIKFDGVLSEMQTDNLKIAAEARIGSSSSAELWRLMGGNPRGETGPQSELTMRLNGLLGGDLQLSANANLQNAKFDYEGTLTTTGGTGNVSLQSDEPEALLRMIGVPLADGGVAAVSLKAKLALGPEKIALTDIAGSAAGGPLTGHLTVMGKTLAGEVSIERLSLVQALAAAFLPWDGAPASAESLIAAQAPFGLTGEVWLRPKLLDVYPGYTVPDGQIGITAKASGAEFVAYGKDPTGHKVSIEIHLDTSLAQRKVTSSMAFPMRLESVLQGSDGSHPVEGVATTDVNVTGQGLSPAAILADLSGQGTFNALETKLTGISPEQFSASIGAVKDAETLQASLSSMRQGQGLGFPPSFGGVSVEKGVATVSPFNMTTSDAVVRVAPVVDLAGRLVRIGVDLDLKALSDLPRTTVTYEGPPASLVRREDITELSAHLGFKVLQQGVDELEKVQAEQARLAKEEEAMRKEDEARLEQFYAQRTEIRLRQRETRIFAGQRKIDADREAERIAAAVAAMRPIIRSELARRTAELAMFGRPLSTGAAVLPRAKPITPIVTP